MGTKEEDTVNLSTNGGYIQSMMGSEDGISNSRGGILRKHSEEVAFMQNFEGQ